MFISDDIRKLPKKERTDLGEKSRKKLIIDPNTRKETIDYKYIRSKLLDLKRNLRFLLMIYPEALSSCGEKRFLLLHLACIYYPSNIEIIQFLVL